MPKTVISVFAGLAIVLGVGITYLLSRSTQVVQTYAQDRGYFYRFRAAFEVKDTGERLDFDYVVACNIRLTRWRDGGLSNDSEFSPRVMVKGTAGGHAVMLKTLNECTGLTSENDNIPPDVLPVAIWFDSVDDLSSGLGYESEDAYNNPLSRLTFHGARIDRSSQAEWEAWRKQSADAFVERGALPGPWGYDYPNSISDFGKYVTECRGYRRLRLAEIIRAKIRPLWPPERPRFWSLPNEDDIRISELLNDSTVKEPPGVEPWFMRFGTPATGGGVDWSGVPVKSGRWVQRPPHVPSRWPTEIYPSLWPPLISIQPVTTTPYGAENETYVQKLEFRAGALNGFAACQNGKDLSATAMQATDPNWLTKRHVFLVDDNVVRERGKDPIFLLKPAFVFDRDEFVFVQFSTLL